TVCPCCIDHNGHGRICVCCGCCCECPPLTVRRVSRTTGCRVIRWKSCTIGGVGCYLCIGHDNVILVTLLIKDKFCLGVCGSTNLCAAWKPGKKVHIGCCLGKTHSVLKVKGCKLVKGRHIWDFRCSIRIGHNNF